MWLCLVNCVGEYVRVHKTHGLAVYKTVIAFPGVADAATDDATILRSFSLVVLVVGIVGYLH